MRNFQVGGYLYGTHKAMGEGLRFGFDDSGGMLLISLRDMKQKEAKKIQKGKLNLALFESDGMLFLLAEIPGVLKWSDAPFHLGLYKDSVSLPEITENTGLGVSIVGVEATTGIIKALRYVGFGTDFSRKMVDIMKKQKTMPISQADYSNKINLAYSKYSCEQMVKKSIAVYKFEARDGV